MTSAAIDIDKLLAIDFHSGKPVVRGSRLRVETLIGQHLQGRSPEDIRSDYPGISLSAVYAALTYYYEHKRKMDLEYAQTVAQSLAAADALGGEIV